MMDIRKIRCTVPCQVEDAKSGCHCAQARDEIERLRAALREVNDITISSSIGDIHGDTQKEWLEAFDSAQSIARAALEGRT